MKTFSACSKDCVAKWWMIDATDLTLGRLASFAAKHIRGKHKPIYTPSMDCGDHVVIINADKIAISGKKITDKKYYRHTGFPGGIKETTAEKLLADGKGERVLENAVRRMIPRSPLGRDQMCKLHVYTGEAHPHEGQKPEIIDFKEMHPMNSRSKN